MQHGVGGYRQEALKSLGWGPSLWPLHGENAC